jgi:hypothetical protein
MTYAIVKTADNTTYISPLFAIKFAGGESAAIGLDPSLSYVQRLDLWLRVWEEGVRIPGRSEVCTLFPTSTAMPKSAGAVLIG